MDVQSLLTPARIRSKRNRMHMHMHKLGSRPDYIQDNEFIIEGYRKEMSFRAALQTMFLWHNETLNIWTHFIGAVLFALQMLMHLQMPMPMLMLLVCNTFMFSVSTLFHIAQCVSRRHFQFYRNLDFIGILVVIYGHFWPYCFYMFSFEWFIIHTGIASGLFIAA